MEDFPLEKCYGCNLLNTHNQTCTWKARSQTTIKVLVTKTIKSLKVYTSIIEHLPKLPESPDTIYRTNSTQNKNHETEMLNIQIPQNKETIIIEKYIEGNRETINKFKKTADAIKH